MRYYFTRDRLQRGEQIHFFSKPETDSSGSSSICNNLDNLLLLLKNSMAGEGPKAASGDASKSARNLLKTLGLAAPEKLAAKFDALDDGSLRQTVPFKTSAFPPSERRFTDNKTKTSERSLLQLCNALPAGKATDMSSISIVFNGDCIAQPDASITQAVPPRDQCFKKKAAPEAERARVTEVPEVELEASPAKKTRKGKTNPTLESNRKRSKSKKIDFKKSKTEELTLGEETLKPECVKHVESKKFSFDRLKLKCVLEENRKSIGAEGRKTVQRLALHHKSLSSNVMQNPQMRASGNLNFLAERKSRASSREPLPRHPPKNTHGHTSSSNHYQFREFVQSKSKHKRFPLSQRSARLGAHKASTCQFEPWTDSGDTRVNQDLLGDSLKGCPNYLKKLPKGLSVKRSDWTQNPIYVNIFAPQLPSARIYFNSEQEELGQGSRKQLKKMITSGRRQNLIQQIFGAASSAKHAPLKSELGDRAAKRTFSHSREIRLEQARPCTHQRAASQSNLHKIPSEKTISSIAKVPPPEIVMIGKGSSAGSDLMKAKLQKVFGAIRRPGLKNPKADRFQLKFSAANSSETMLRNTFLQNLGKK